MSLTRKIILAIFFIGFAGNVGGAGTFASFNASTSNPTSTFATGTLVLSNQKNTATACLSATGNVTDTNSANCDTLFTTSVAKPGTTATVDVTLVNEGTLDGTLKLYAPGSCTPSNDGGTYHGTGDLCDAVRMTIQRYASAANRTAGTGSVCVYDLDNAGATCASDATRHIDHFTDTYTSSVAALSLGTLAANNGTDSDSAFLRITLEFPNGTPAADNPMQGRVATWAYTWLLEQN